MKSPVYFLLTLASASACCFVLFAQAPNPPRGDGPGFGGGRFGPPGGVQEETKLLKQFDKDHDKILNSAERKAALEFLAQERSEGRGGRRMAHAAISLPQTRSRVSNFPPMT